MRIARIKGSCESTTTACIPDFLTPDLKAMDSQVYGDDLRANTEDDIEQEDFGGDVSVESPKIAAAGSSSFAQQHLLLQSASQQLAATTQEQSLQLSPLPARDASKFEDAKSPASTPPTPPPPMQRLKRKPSSIEPEAMDTLQSDPAKATAGEAKRIMVERPGTENASTADDEEVAAHPETKAANDEAGDAKPASRKPRGMAETFAGNRPPSKEFEKKLYDLKRAMYDEAKKHFHEQFPDMRKVITAAASQGSFWKHIQADLAITYRLTRMTDQEFFEARATVLKTSAETWKSRVAKELAACCRQLRTATYSLTAR